MNRLLELVRGKPVIREYDAQGRLTAAGFKWKEPVEIILLPFGLAAIVLIYIAFGVATVPELDGSPFPFVIAAGLCVLICLACGSIDRGIAFDRDGKLKNKGGMTSWFELLGKRRDHANVASIEIIKTQRGAGIAVYTTDGGTLVLTDGLNEPDARVVAVQLTIALREIRDSMASVRAYQGVTSSGETDAAAWID